jgi:type I restriction enzyme S subunit
MKRGWTEVALGEVLYLDLDAVQVDPTQTYPFAGVYGFGRGLFVRESVRGSDTTYSHFHRLHPGKLVMSQPKGWEGAITIVPPEFSGRFLSKVFPTFGMNEQRLHPNFLKWITKCKWLWDALVEKSNGIGARRNSIYPEQLFEVQIPLPPLAEQQRIVAHLDAIEHRLHRIRKLREEGGKLRDALVISLHHAAAEGREVRIGDLLELDEDRVPITPEGSYPQVGIRSFGNGMFTKGAVLGSETTYKSFNRLAGGKFVMSQVKGWEGAVAVCPRNLEGWYVSPEYRTFSCLSGQCDADYLSHIVVTEWFHQQLLSATRGVGARRERVRPEMLLNIRIPFPQITKQREAARVFGQLRAAQTASASAVPPQEALIASILDRVFHS